MKTSIQNLIKLIEQFKRSGCTFSAVCLQESWLSDDSDTSLFQLDGYNLISQGKRCSTRGGLIIYLKDTIKYKLIDIEANSNIWEGQFILKLNKKMLVTKQIY